MVDSSFTSTPPTSEELIRFFQKRSPVPLGAVAKLVGVTESQISLDLSNEGVLRKDGMADWEDVASRLLLAWPRTWLFHSLGAYAEELPTDLRPVPVTWMLPRYLVVAMAVQAKLRSANSAEVHTDDISHYVADLLDLAIEPYTVDVLRADAAFMEAFGFPHGSDDAEASEPLPSSL
jgi:hypothetical protein